MDEQQRGEAPVLLPAPNGPSVQVTAEQGGRLYQQLRERDRNQRARARLGSPVTMVEEGRTQTALLLAEPYATTGGEMSAGLVELLHELRVAVFTR